MQPRFRLLWICLLLAGALPAQKRDYRWMLGLRADAGREKFFTGLAAELHYRHSAIGLYSYAVPLSVQARAAMVLFRASPLWEYVTDAGGYEVSLGLRPEQVRQQSPVRFLVSYAYYAGKRYGTGGGHKGFYAGCAFTAWRLHRTVHATYSSPSRPDIPPVVHDRVERALLVSGGLMGGWRWLPQKYLVVDLQVHFPFYYLVPPPALIWRNKFLGTHGELCLTLGWRIPQRRS